jgi:hypothetical protein
MHVAVAPNKPAAPEKLTVPDGGPAAAPSESVTVAEHVAGTPRLAGLGAHATATDVGRRVTVNVVDAVAPGKTESPP